MQTRKEAKVIAQRLSQDGVTMYVASLEAGLINELGVVDTWKPYLEDLDPDQGYQRAVVTAHAKRIAKYSANPVIKRKLSTTSRCRAVCGESRTSGSKRGGWGNRLSSTAPRPYPTDYRFAR